MSHDLFGDPIPTLCKNTEGYLTQLSYLNLADGWHFWALAEPDKNRPRPVDQYECVWLARGDGSPARRAYIDLLTGEEARS
jgi:hypothetical protein